jgi:N-acetylglutamate synthase-like GNAT family acetyltransferase
MTGKRRLDGGLLLRRARRADLDRLRGLLSGRPAPRAERFDRRTLADLGQDVYVAEAPDGALVGVVAVAYVRSLRGGRFAGVLDTARAAAGAAPALLEALLDVAEERARRRGCRRVRAWLGPDDRMLRAALASRGWRVEESLDRELVPESEEEQWS